MKKEKVCPIRMNLCIGDECAWYTEEQECALKTLGEAMYDLALRAEINGIKVNEE